MNFINSEESKKTKVSIGAMLSVMELVIAIGMFAIISTFLLRFFTLANRLSDEASEVSKASVSVEAIFEQIKGSGFEAAMKEIGFDYSETRASGKYDKKFQVADGEDEAYYLVEIERAEGEKSHMGLYSYQLRLMKASDGSVLFEMSGKTCEKGW